MGYSIVLLAVGLALIGVIQALRIFLKSDSYRRRSLHLTLGVAFFFAPISASLMLLSSGMLGDDTGYLVALSGIGSLVAIYFFARAAINT